MAAGTGHKSDDPPAILAKKLLLLDQPGDERAALLDLARADLVKTAGKLSWSVLDDQREASNPLADEALISLLRRSGTAALSELLKQRDVDGGAGA